MSSPPDTVLLIDIENIIGQKAKPQTMAARLNALTSQAGPGVPAIAACGRGRITDPSAQVLRTHNVTLLTVASTPDAADKALITEARRLAQQGCRRFLVASADSHFAQLADLGTFEIIVWTTQKTSRAYVERASKIHHLPPPTRTTFTQAAPTPRQPPTITATAPAARPTARRPVAPVQQHQGSDSAAWAAVTRLRTPARLALSGLALLAAGAIFGIGTAIGDLTTRQVISPRIHRYRGGPDEANDTQRVA